METTEETLPPAEAPVAPTGNDDAGDALLNAVEEAEQRGYLRGLNEAASKRMQEPAMYEAVAPPGADTAAAEPCDFLSQRRRSIWDEP